MGKRRKLICAVAVFFLAFAIWRFWPRTVADMIGVERAPSDDLFCTYHDVEGSASKNLQTPEEKTMLLDFFRDVKLSGPILLKNVIQNELFSGESAVLYCAWGSGGDYDRVAIQIIRDGPERYRVNVNDTGYAVVSGTETVAEFLDYLIKL